MGDAPIDGSGKNPWSGYDAAALLASSGDVSILLSERIEVLDVVVPEKKKFDFDLRTKWCGRGLVDIVAKDSAVKIPSLLGLDATPSVASDRWRHLNFMVESDSEIPLLAKSFRVQATFGPVHQIVCRDLRPMTELNARWQAENEKLLKQIAREPAPSAEQFSASASALVGAAPLADIMAAAADEVARICIAEALRSCRGDEFAAAELLGITRLELRRRKRASLH
ncbi:helix-turn-helix domain-containing protein [Yoonia sp. R2331]|uniref:helix-turn-helix domain-containing protein n=1 Tax=Yoonia sp. R2331 TaxID=3237238 RepID=UPI0034E5F713